MCFLFINEFSDTAITRHPRLIDFTVYDICSSNPCAHGDCIGSTEYWCACPIDYVGVTCNGEYYLILIKCWCKTRGHG